MQKYFILHDSGTEIGAHGDPRFLFSCDLVLASAWQRFLMCSIVCYSANMNCTPSVCCQCSWPSSWILYSQGGRWNMETSTPQLLFLLVVSAMKKMKQVNGTENDWSARGGGWCIVLYTGCFCWERSQQGVTCKLRCYLARREPGEASIQQREQQGHSSWEGHTVGLSQEQKAVQCERDLSDQMKQGLGPNQIGQGWALGFYFKTNGTVLEDFNVSPHSSLTLLLPCLNCNSYPEDEQFYLYLLITLP